MMQIDEDIIFDYDVVASDTDEDDNGGTDEDDNGGTDEDDSGGTDEDDSGGTDEDDNDGTGKRAFEIAHAVYEDVLERFIAVYARGPRQRAEDWYVAKRGVIGGSELAILLGMSPFSKTDDLVRDKIFPKDKQTYMEACWWGTTFEPVITTCVEVDCGTHVVGDDIWIPSHAVPHHANSPDGYAILTFFNDGDECDLVCGADKYEMSGRRIVEKIAVLEFKCPYRRAPDGTIPHHYMPQVWDELALSPIAHIGMFVDAKFCKCTFDDLGANLAYDTTYHRKTAPRDGTAPIAWGCIAIYMPFTHEWADNNAVVLTLNKMYTRACGVPPGYTDAFVDCGKIPWYEFNKILEIIAGGKCEVRNCRPTFTYEYDDDSDEDTLRDGLIMECNDNTPEGCVLFGVLPWKLFDVYYSFVEPRPGYLDEIRPLIKNTTDTINYISAHRDQTAAMRSYKEYVKSHARPGERLVSEISCDEWAAQWDQEAGGKNQESDNDDGPAGPTVVHDFSGREVEMLFALGV